MKTALITGASAGLGLEFIRQIHDVFPEIECFWLVARRPERADLPEIPGVLLKPVALDLTATDCAGQLGHLLEEEKPQIELLIGCAGCGYLGNFEQTDLGEQLRMVDLNVRALTAVTRTVLPFMPDGSHIIHISSIASFVPTARMTVYGATKSYVSAFSRGLHTELKPRKISVTAVCPGPMETEFLSVGRIKGQSKTFDMLPYCDPVNVVRGALKATKHHRAVYTPRALYKVYRVLASLIPHAIFVHFAKT